MVIAPPLPNNGAAIAEGWIPAQINCRSAIRDKAERIKTQHPWTRPWVHPGMFVVASANTEHPFEVLADQVLGSITKLGCGGWDEGGQLHHIGFDLDVGHGGDKYAYATTADAINAARQIRNHVRGAAEIRLSKSGVGVHVRVAIAAGAVPSDGRKTAGLLAKTLAGGLGVRCDPAVLGRQNLWFWCDAVSNHGFELIEPCHGAWIPLPLGADSKPAIASLASSVVKPAADRQQVIAQARSYLATQRGAKSGQGGHNHTFRVVCSAVQGFDLSSLEAWPLLCEWNQNCEPPWSENELRHKLDDALKVDDPLKESGARRRLLKPTGVVQSSLGEKCSADLAEAYLDQTGLRDQAGLRLRYYRDEFFSYSGTHYEPEPETDLTARIIRFLQDNPATREMAGPRQAAGIVANLAALALVPTHVELPALLSEPPQHATHLIPMSNGALEINRMISGETLPLKPHTPTLFNRVCLPYGFDPAAICPTWDRFLTQMLPDPDVRDLLQEWFGLNLVYNTSFEKFMILVGEGANGKTVVVTVLREMLGTGNHSGVGLEAFNPVRTFPLAATIGKLANIVGEISEMDRAAEGTIKMFVSGERMTIERKHKDAFEVTPTARLTFATNILPRFTDRSDGIWRRLLLIPFNGQILDPGRQDRRLISPEFWRTSGELAGVFNWAVTGLRRLQQRGHFIEPVVCSVAKGAYKLDSNPAGQFLVETCAARTGFSVATNLLHADYKKWVEERGCKPLSAGQFAKEVKRAFPNVSLSNPLAQPSGARSRAWIGIVSNQ